MGFLNPVFAVAALAVAVPIVLHLVRRREVRRWVFPAIRYLRRAEQRHARRLRLRHLLLLATRVLIVLLAASAAAGPLIGRGEAGDHRPTALAIVMDESQSSGQLLADRRFLDLYSERAMRSLDLVTGADRFALFSAVRPEEGAVTNNMEGAREYLRGLQPTAGLAQLPAAVEQAYAWLSSFTDLAHELHIFTDMQRVSLEGHSRGAPDEVGAGAGVSAIVYTPELLPTTNGALGRPVPEVHPLSAGLQTSVSVPLVFYGGEAPTRLAVVRLVVGEDVVGLAEGNFGSQILLRLPPQESGWVQGYVETDRHGLAADDRRYFTWFVRAAPTVTTLGDSTRFLLHALDALERGGRVRRAEPADAEVWIAESGERLEDGLAAGRSVIVHPPTSALDLTRLNLRLSRAGVAWRYDVQERSRGEARIGETRALEGLAGLAVHSSYRLTPSGLAVGDSVLVRLTDEQPWVIRGNTPEGAAYLLLGSPLTPEASEVAVSAGMVPFVDAMVGEWARRGVIEPANIDGVTSIRLPARAREVIYPDGSQAFVEGGARLPVRQAGNYRVLDGDRVSLAFSLNAPLPEADLTPARREALERSLPAAEWSWSRAERPDQWVNGAFLARRGKLAWRPFVVFILLVSIIEAVLAAAGRQRPSGTMRQTTSEVTQSQR